MCNIRITNCDDCKPSSWLWCECSAGSHSGEEKHLYWYPLLDGPGGHRLWREPRCYIWLQGKASTKEQPFFLRQLSKTGQMCLSGVFIHECYFFFQSDLWSCGITAIEMAEGAPRKHQLLWFALNLHCTLLKCVFSYSTLWHAPNACSFPHPKESASQAQVQKMVSVTVTFRVWSFKSSKMFKFSSVSTDRMFRYLL